MIEAPRASLSRPSAAYPRICGSPDLESVLRELLEPLRASINFRLWGSCRCRRMGEYSTETRLFTWIVHTFDNHNSFLSEGGVFSVVVESLPEMPQQPRRCRFSRHRGLRHGSGRRERRE